MAIKRKPSNPMFRVMDGPEEIMRFRMKNLQSAKAEARRQTAILRRKNPGIRYDLQFYSNEKWEPAGEIK